MNCFTRMSCSWYSRLMCAEAFPAGQVSLPSSRLLPLPQDLVKHEIASVVASGHVVAPVAVAGFADMQAQHTSTHRPTSSPERLAVHSAYVGCLSSSQRGPEFIYEFKYWHWFCLISQGDTPCESSISCQNGREDASAESASSNQNLKMLPADASRDLASLCQKLRMLHLRAR